MAVRQRSAARELKTTTYEWEGELDEARSIESSVGRIEVLNDRAWSGVCRSNFLQSAVYGFKEKVSRE